MKRLLLILFISSTLFYMGCDSLEVDNSDKFSIFELNLEVIDGIVNLSWAEVNHSDFQQYLIVRSSASIPDDLSINGGASILAQIEDMEETTYTDYSFSTGNQIFFKVFINIGNRLIPSTEVSVNTENLSFSVAELPYSFNDVAFSPQKQSLYYTSSMVDAIIEHNLDDKSSTILTSLIGAYNTNLEMYPYNGTDELYVLDNYNNDIKIYRTDNFSLQTTINNNDDCYSLAKNHSDMMVSSMDEYNYSTKVHRRDNITYLNAHNYANYYEFRFIKPFSDTENKFLEISGDKARVYTFDNNGHVTDYKEQTFSNFGFSKKLVVSPDYQYFLAYRDGSVYDKELNKVGQLDNDNFNTTYSDFAFSSDSKHIFAISFNNELAVYTVPELELSKKINLGYGSEYAFINGDEELILIGYYFNPLTFSQIPVVQRLKLTNLL